MLKSMTGYGRCERLAEGRKILVELRSVNQRFTDYGIKLPKHLGFLEEPVRSFASEYITRGKVDIYISVENYEEADKDIHLNTALAASYISALAKLRDEFDLRDDISVMSVAQFGDIFKAERREEDRDEIWRLVKGVMEEAMAELVAMREREGERIEKDLVARIEYMKTLTEKIDERSPQTVAEYREKLYAKIKELLEEREPDETRLLTEVAIFADKIAVNEETVRLSSHFEEFYNIIGSGEPAGRKLDFLIQEINREVNTIGSKAQDVEIAKLVVTLKGEIEKLREQVQNIE
ncbi:MAG TPA: YicC family protein [Candidatus Ornithomonoglobus intestinigallinarum]|uniref:YicC family protein n=1 Tax=Candidatus Ornithomonoglobus intestinigallinarum TaxID=2840894 RepID=A0A9D1KQN8_9FIRM|nr:YicC family protein [Candidatus Ornithomonoglobus intestinigallinarum]